MENSTIVIPNSATGSKVLQIALRDKDNNRFKVYGMGGFEIKDVIDDQFDSNDCDGDELATIIRLLMIAS